MKIIKTKVEALKENQVREAALAGCDICPCCRENKSHLFYIKRGITNKGIVSGICRNWYGKYKSDSGILYNFFHTEKNKYYQVDCFSCLTCGAKWESDPYQAENNITGGTIQ